MADNRYCTKDEQPVRPMVKADKIWGKVTSRFDAQLYVHISDSYRSVPNCGKQFLEEIETFTEGDEDS